MTRTLIIPDIHNNWVDAEITITDVNPDQTVFLGDYFDSYGDMDNGVETVVGTAYWLSDSLKRPDRIHLIGNHDLSYLSEGALQCGGYSPMKERAVKQHMTVDLWKKMRWYYWVDDNYLCTHAGLSKDFYLTYNDRLTKPLSVREFMEKESEIAWNTIYDGCKDDHIFWHCSPERGGIDPYAGILWCDWKEFKPIDPIKQLFGHTAGDFVRRQGDNFCLDTMGKNWAVYDSDTKFITVRGTDIK
jgi:hypothetical protein